MTSNKRPWVRRVLFADRRYRSALFGYAFLLSAITSGGSYVAEWAFSHWLAKNPEAQKIVSTEMLPQVFAGFTFLAMAITLIVFGFMISGRLVGPFFRMRNHMDSVTEGLQTKTEFKFRKEDFFIEVGESYNRLLQVVQAQRQLLPKSEREAAPGLNIVPESGSSKTAS